MPNVVGAAYCAQCCRCFVPTVLQVSGAQCCRCQVLCAHSVWSCVPSVTGIWCCVPSVAGVWCCMPSVAGVRCPHCCRCWVQVHGVAGGRCCVPNVAGVVCPVLKVSGVPCPMLLVLCAQCWVLCAQCWVLCAQCCRCCVLGAQPQTLTCKSAVCVSDRCWCCTQLEVNNSWTALATHFTCLKSSQQQNQSLLNFVTICIY